MKQHDLSFCSLIHASKNIIEIIFKGDIEVDDAMVDELHRYLSAHQEETACLLINVMNDYTYTFSAQQRIGLLPHIKAMACLVYRETSRITSKLIKKIRTDIPLKIEIFDDYDTAIKWLESQQD